MLTSREVVASLYGAYRLARFDASGLALFNNSPSGALRSFFAAVIVAPLYALMLATVGPGAGHTDPYRFVLVEVVAYLTSWVAYPVVVEWLSRRLGCRERFEGYLAAYNWSMVLQNAAVLPISIVANLDLLPQQLGQFLWLGVFLLTLVYVGFIARVGLAVRSGTAVGLVLLDVLLSALIDGLASEMY